MSVEIKRVVTDEFEMNYFKFGTGERTAVILPGLSVKSVMDSAESVASAYKAMSEDYTVYLFDRRTVCPENYSIDDMAYDTARAFELLGLKDIYLLGVSQGGMIAQTIAFNYPTLVHKLVLCSTIARITEDNSRVIKEWTELAKKRDRDSLNKSIIDAIYSDKFSEKYGGFIMRLLGGASDEDLDRFIILAESCDSFDVYSRLSEIRCPTLVIGSKTDKVFDFKYIAELAEQLGAQFSVYEGYSHALYDETPDCIKEIIEFYNKDF